MKHQNGVSKPDAAPDSTAEQQQQPPSTKCSRKFSPRLRWALIPVLFLIVALILRTYIYTSESQHLPAVTLPLSSPVKPPIKPNDLKKPVVPLKEPKKRPSRAVNVTDQDMVDFLNSVYQMTLDDFLTVEQEPFKLRDILKFNNLHFFPRISSIVQMDPFRFVKFNLKRPCTLFPDIFSCTKISCNIKFCSKSDLPKAYTDLDERVEQDCPMNSPKALSMLDNTLSAAKTEALNELFECTRDDSEASMYYDLVRNPERYTGYDGSAIWKNIYEENCFARQHENIFTSVDKRCYEERMFYKIISGLHTSITTHLVAIDHKFGNVFGPNQEQYRERFYGKHNYMKNLFFIYLIELRALFKIRPYLLDKIRWNLMEQDKVQAQDAIADLLKTERLFKWHFDDDGIFTQESVASELAAHFHNITFNIIDCVSCDKCRLWGKVQTNGLGTAFKILLTKDVGQLRLSHHEITCLLNAVGRLSNSISEIEKFLNLFKGDKVFGDAQAKKNDRSKETKILNKFL